MDKRDLIPLCRKSLLAYAIAMWPGYEPADHLRRLANALERVARGELKRLIVTMPPRHGKSMLCSEFFPAWLFGSHPDNQVIHCSYSQELVDSFGRKIRNQLKDELYGAVFPNTSLSDDSQAQDKFNIAGHQGAYIAVGVGGSATGKGAHVLLIDDPIKDREAADSELQRTKLKDWYTSVAYTRLMKGGAIVVIQTRWHEDDLAGWLLKEHAHENWEVLNLMAIEDEDSTPKALWPESYPLERLLQIKQTLPPRDWEALYQQRPRAGTGADFKRQWLNFYTTVQHRGMYKLMLVDPASGKRKNNDFTSIWIIGLGEDENYYVLDAIRDRMNLTERSEAVFRMHRKWKPSQVRYERYGMMADIEHIKSEMNAKSYRFPITEVGGITAKEDRIRRLVPVFQQGRVWMPEEIAYTGTDGKPRNLIHDFIEEEYLAFPVGRHDDMLDGLARMVEPTLDTPWPHKRNRNTKPLPSFGVLDASCGY
jgi:predicted phage terminase large subunit-like protein